MVLLLRYAKHIHKVGWLVHPFICLFVRCSFVHLFARSFVCVVPYKFSLILFLILATVEPFKNKIVDHTSADQGKTTCYPWSFCQVDNFEEFAATC